MKFLLYSINHGPELTGIGKYNGELVPALAQRDIETHVLTAPPYYPEWQVHDGFKNRYSHSQKSGVSVYRCPLYVPKKVTTIKRLIHLSSFALSSALRLITLLRLKPNVVFLVQPTLFCAPATLLYCKLTGSKSVMHIQDFEIDAMFGLGLAGSLKDKSTTTEAQRKAVGKSNISLVKRIIRSVETWLLRRFDVVSSISYSMLDNAKSKGVDESKLLFFPNWADTNFVTPEVSGDALRKEWGFTNTDKVVLYSGNIGQKQGLEIVLDAAQALKNRPEVKFVIVGSGAYSETLKKMAVDKGLTNIQFKPLQAWALVPQILSMADVHLVVQKRGAADAVLPSKLTNILSAGGHALITADMDTELGKIALKYPGIYQCVEPESSDAFVSGLVKCLGTDTRQVNTVARDYAVANINVDTVIDRFVVDMQALVRR